MKKVISFFGALLLLLTPCVANAQAKDEINLTAGFITGPEFVHVFSGIFVTMFSLGYANILDAHMTGGFGLEYFHNFGGVVSAGCIGSYEHIWGVQKNKDDEVTGDINVNVGALMPAAKFTWLTKPKFEMYSKVAVGATLYNSINSTDPHVTFAYQLSPVGMNVGGEHHRFMAELGLLGMQGSLLVGYSYRF